LPRPAAFETPPRGWMAVQAPQISTRIFSDCAEQQVSQVRDGALGDVIDTASSGLHALS